VSGVAATAAPYRASVRHPRAALALGGATLVLVIAACLLAWQDGSPLVPRDGGRVSGSAVGFFVLLAVSFGLYVLALALLRRRTAPLGAVVALALAIQLAPLLAPLLLSTDAWTYWAYGRIAAVEGGNPYVDPPSAYPESPAYAVMGERWRDTTSVYGPAFTLASEPLALAARDSEDTAAWFYKIIAAAAVTTAAIAAARVAPRRALALAFVGWNPVLAVHLGGGGHNDAWVGALMAVALALAASRRAQLAGASWALAAAVKWVPLLLLPLFLLRERARKHPVGWVGLAVAALVIAVLATWRYGLDWLRAVVPLLENAERETSYALPHRLEQLGLPDAAATAIAATAFAAGFVLLLRSSAAGRSVLGRGALLLLATTPYLTVWYLAWALPLAAADDDTAARLGCLAFAAYLLPQTIPL
jgi:Glycosyltransferase family 87